jgi:hypothetical protein
MAIFGVEYSTLSDTPNSALIFTFPRGDNTALVVAQRPGSPMSLFVHIETVLTAAFRTYAELDKLDARKLEIYATFRLMPEPRSFDDAGRWSEIRRVFFPGGMRRRVRGLTLAREWSFKDPEWSMADDSLTDAFDRVAWKAGLMAQTYDIKRGWAIPDATS